MIAHIKGTIDTIYENAVIIECNNIGYYILVSGSTIAGLSGQKEAKLITTIQVREDNISLIGFLSKEDLKMFELLTGVSGVGAKAALSLQSALSYSQIMLAVLSDDSTALSKAQGVGKKIAQRIALELKDKIKSLGQIAGQYDDMTGAVQSFKTAVGGEKQEAVEALVSLGYGRSEAVKAVLEVALDGMATEQIIKLSLKKLTSF